jgi:hypothetical protein
MGRGLQAKKLRDAPPKTPSPHRADTPQGPSASKNELRAQLFVPEAPAPEQKPIPLGRLGAAPAKAICLRSMRMSFAGKNIQVDYTTAD